MITVPVTVTTYSIGVSVTNDVVTVDVTATPIVIDVSVSYGIPDAPSDGKQYARKDKSWIEVALTPTDIEHNSTTERDADAAHPASSITYGDGNVKEILDNRFLDVDEGNNINIDKTDTQRPVINVNETSTFTDTLITGLKSDVGVGGEVPAVDYNWFKGVYASLVDSSVKSWIIGLVNRLKDAVTRIETLETKIIADYTLPTNQSVASFPEITIANLGIVQGQDFSVHVYLPALPDNAAQAAIQFRFNVVDTDATKYYTATTDGTAISLTTGATEGSFIMTFRWKDNKVEGMLTTYRITSGTRTVQVTTIGTNGNWLTAVSSFIIRTTQIVTWPANLRVIIKKM